MAELLNMGEFRVWKALHAIWADLRTCIDLKKKQGMIMDLWKSLCNIFVPLSTGRTEARCLDWVIPGSKDKAR